MIKNVQLPHNEQQMPHLHHYLFIHTLVGYRHHRLFNQEKPKTMNIAQILARQRHKHQFTERAKQNNSLSLIEAYTTLWYIMIAEMS